MSTVYEGGGRFFATTFSILTAMSDRALAYSEEPLSHRFIVIFEAAGLESEFATYLLRSLLSEGRIKYETVERSPEGGMVSRLIEREGPTGALITTTATTLHAENETRLLSLTVADTPEQTKAILDKIALDEDEEPPDLAQWHALQTWLKHENHRVAIPYLTAVADMMPAIAVRLRRDFSQLKNLIKAHAVLHQTTREEDDTGRIIATLDDYSAVYDLIANVLAEGHESPTLRPSKVASMLPASWSAMPAEAAALAATAIDARAQVAASNRQHRFFNTGIAKLP